MSNFTQDSAKLADIIGAHGSNWGAISADSAARMRAQNRFQTGLEIAKYTAGVMREDMVEYDAAPRGTSVVASERMPVGLRYLHGCGAWRTPRGAAVGAR